MGNDTASFLIILLCCVMITNGLVTFITSNVIILQSQAFVHPPISVLYYEFNGSTTNFSSFDEAGLRIISNLTLEVTSAGKVVFDGVTDITADRDEHNVIDIDGSAQFSGNSIYIDTGVITSLRKSGSVFLYGLNFIDPVVLVDGYVCPPTICQVIVYENGTLVFRVTQFSRQYSAQEEEAAEETRPSGGAAYTYRPVPLSNFSVSKAFIKAAVRQGETFLDSVTIENTGQTPLGFNLTVTGMADKVALSEESFTLAPGKSRTVTVAFTAMENSRADVYAGKLIVSAGGMAKTVLLVMEIKERKALFDVYLNLEGVPFEAAPGTDVEADILLYNFGDLRPVDVTLYYALRDFDGNELLYKHDTVAVDEQKNVKRTIRLPEDLKDGMYLFYARVEYGNQTASSSGIIQVSGKRAGVPGDAGWVAVMMMAAVVVAAVLAFALSRRRRSPGMRPYGNEREKLLMARISREEAEREAGLRRAERVEAEREAAEERRKRAELEKRVAEERWKRKKLSERLARRNRES